MKKAFFFHGNFQNAQFFKIQRKLYKLENELISLNYECHFVNGFYEQDRINNNCNEPRNWFDDAISTEEYHFKIQNMIEKYQMEENKEIVLIGFSAGALFIDYILRHNFLRSSNIKCILCGLNGTLTSNLKLPNIPSMHIIGINDEFVSMNHSKQIYKKWKKRNARTMVFYHDKKHCFPMYKKILDEILKFIMS